MRCCCIGLYKFSYNVFVDIYGNVICSSMIDTYRSVFLSKEKSYGKSCGSTNITNGTHRLSLLIGTMTCVLPLDTSLDVSRTSYFCKCIGLSEDIILWHIICLLIFHVSVNHEMNRRGKITYVYSIVNSLVECNSGSILYLWVLTHTFHGCLLSRYGYLIYSMNSRGNLNNHTFQGQI